MATTSDSRPTMLDARPYWKPRDLAHVLDMSASQIYRLIESGELASVRIGQRTVRVPAAAVAAFRGEAVPEVHEESAEERVRRFTERTGHTPEAFIDAWKREEIEDSAEHHEDAMEAMALWTVGVRARQIAHA